MSSMYRLVDSEGELLADGDTIGYLKGLLGDLEQGRYAVDENLRPASAIGLHVEAVGSPAEARGWHDHRRTRSLGILIMPHTYFAHITQRGR